MNSAQAGRIAHHEATARYMLAAGFTTKSGQKEAKEHASRAYSLARELVQSVALNIPKADRTEAQEDLYYDLPHGPHQWRAKHGAAVREHLPTASEHVATVERLVALYTEIAAAPVNLAPRNPDGTRVRVPHRSEAFNPELREQFMAQAPALTAHYDRDVRGVFARYTDKFGVAGVIPADLFPGVWPLTDAQTNQQRTVSGFIARHATLVNGPSRGNATVRGYVLDEAELARRAKQYGEEVAMAWFFKTNRKLGELTDAKLVRDNHCGDVIVSGRKGEHRIDLRQQVIGKWAPVKREVFHQFPALIFVDGKFTPEAAYAKRFDIKD